jgi:hypothetical protein
MPEVSIAAGRPIPNENILVVLISLFYFILNLPSAYIGPTSIWVNSFDLQSVFNNLSSSFRVLYFT